MNVHSYKEGLEWFFLQILFRVISQSPLALLIKEFLIKFCSQGLRRQFRVRILMCWAVSLLIHDLRARLGWQRILGLQRMTILLVLLNWWMIWRTGFRNVADAFPCPIFRWIALMMFVAVSVSIMGT
jgi:lysylphosphatidylglycerol synthetase-like protein (DUF2156 family)